MLERLIDCLEIKTIEVLLAEGVGLLDSVECWPVIHRPSMASKKIYDCMMVREKIVLNYNKLF